jgi:HPt (histidine-containing phosphotransfer) domain-containing protein
MGFNSDGHALEKSAADAGWSLPEALHELPPPAAARLVGQLIEPFQTDTAIRLKRVRSAINGENIAALRAEVHSLKGSSSQVGAYSMSSLCEEIEVAIGQVAASRIMELVDRMELQCAAAVSAMRACSGS